MPIPGRMLKAAGPATVVGMGLPIWTAIVWIVWRFIP